PAFLRNGLNVVAVELHQSGGTSSDLGFDLALDAEYISTTQSLKLVESRMTNQLAISWARPAVGHVLQSTPRLPQTNQWSTVTHPNTISGTNHRVTITATSNGFFR